MTLIKLTGIHQQGLVSFYVGLSSLGPHLRVSFLY
jgi:hypothetical protein